MSLFEWIVVVAVGIALIALAFLLGRALQRRKDREEARQARKVFETRSRATLKGQLSEQLAPYLPGFPYSPSEARFIGKPVDFLIFEGMDQKDIRNVVFVEVKSGGSRLSPQERKLRDAIQNKRVSWYEYRTPSPETD